MQLLRQKLLVVMKIAKKKTKNSFSGKNVAFDLYISGKMIYFKTNRGAKENGLCRQNESNDLLKLILLKRLSQKTFSLNVLIKIKTTMFGEFL